MMKSKDLKPAEGHEKRLDDIRKAFGAAFAEAISKSGIEGLKRTSMFGRSHLRG